MRTEHAEAVRVVHHDAGTILLRKPHDLRQVADVAAHAEHTVGHDQFACGIGDLLQLPFKVLHVVVAVAQHGGVAELAAVIDARVVLPVADDVIILAGNGTDDAEVALEARGERHHGFLAEEMRKLLFQLHMQLQRAVKEAGTGAAGAVPLQGFKPRLDHARVRGQAEIVVGAKHDAALAFHDDFNILPGFKLVKVRVDVCGADLVHVGVGAFCE